MSDGSKSYPKESGPIPNVINDEWSKHLKGNEFKITFLIARKTFGFNKTWDKIAISQMAKYTGLSERTCQRLRKDLVNRGVILCKGTAGGKSSECCEYSINMGWRPVARDKVAPATTNVSRGDKIAPEGVTAATPTKLTLQNSQVQNTQNAREAHPFDYSPLKTGASQMCIDAMTAYHREISKRPNALPDPIHWDMWVSLCGDERIVFETIMGIVQSQSKPERDRPKAVYRLDNLFREQHTVAFWRAYYKQPSTQAQWWSGLSEAAIIDRLISLLRYGIEIPQELEKWIPQAQQKLSERLAG